jgi:type III secretion protein D
MNARHAPMTVSNLVLRVLAGRQNGAEYRLMSGLSVTIGHSFNHDVVLRGPDTQGLSLELMLTDLVAQLKVVSGQVQLLGRPMTAGDSAQLPAFVPVSFGETCFAIGDAQSERWSEAAAIFEAPVAATQNPEAISDEAAAALTPAPVPRTKSVDNAIQHFASHFQPAISALALDRRWPLYAGVAALLLLIAAISGPVGQFIESNNTSPAAIETKLARAGFKDVKAIDSGSGKIILRGLLRNDAELSRLRIFASDKLDGIEINVRTLDELAAAATGILSGQSVDAEAKPARGNSLLISSEYLPRDRQDELIAMIKKDIPQISNVYFQIVGERGDKDLQYFFSSGEYGLASFIDGDPAYIKTADGTRWFKGAVLPTGHNITDIGSGRVQFERNGRIEELTIFPEGAKGSAETPVTGNISTTVEQSKERT